MKKLWLLLIILLSSSGVLAEQISVDFKELIANIKKQQNKCVHCYDLKDVKCIQEQIRCCAEIDQKIRHISINLDPDEKNALLKQFDEINTKRLKLILKTHGWLTISKFGKETDNFAWLLVQHADHDPEFQASIAFILEHLLVLGETEPKNFAYLYDRVAINLNHIGLRQRYGTQMTIENNEVKLLPFEGDLKELNKRRQAMGLNSIEEYLKQLKGIYLKH